MTSPMSSGVESQAGGDSSPDLISRVDGVRRVSQRLAASVRVAGAIDAAYTLERAAAFRSIPAEELLELRSALVRTRPVWEAHAAEHLRSLGSRTLTDAKRLAIEMP